MKIVIQHKGVKREIEADSFMMCGSRDDLEAVARSIDNANIQSYGWLTVCKPEPVATNTPPEPWC
jgi:hypothetical protein